MVLAEGMCCWKKQKVEKMKQKVEKMKRKVVVVLQAAEDELPNPAVKGQQSREISTVGTVSSFVDGHHRG
jgi:hypothetical protein